MRSTSLFGLWASLLIITVDRSSARTDFSCPRNCECTTASESHPHINYFDRNLYDVRCNSIEGLAKLIQYEPKQATYFRTLDISNTATKKLNTKLLNKMKNLQVLNVSWNDLQDLPNPIKLIQLTDIYLQHNQIKTISHWFFPKSLTHIDLSFNDLQQIPDNLQNIHVSLPKLQMLLVDGNRFECSCTNRNAFHTYAKYRIQMDLDHCWDSQKPHKLKDLLPCMSDAVADEGFQSSGDGDSDKLIVFPDDDPTDDLNEFIHVESTSQPELPQNNSDFYFRPSIEASGDDSLQIFPIANEGSGSEPNITSSTLDPIIDDREGSGDLDSYEEWEDYSTSSTTTSGPIIIPVVIKVEETTTEESKDQVEEVFTKTKLNTLEAHHRDTNVNEELGQIKEENKYQTAYSTYIFLVIIVVLAVALLGYTCIKRSKRSHKRCYELDDAVLGTELKNIEKLELANHDKNCSNGVINEVSPMLPTNGTTKQLPPEQIPLRTTTDDKEEKSPSRVSSPPRNSNEAEKVRITLTELTDSIPKTPKLVIRTRSAVDDKIILTPNLNQRPSLSNNNN